MIDESYCWVVAISNRREYIENELPAARQEKNKAASAKQVPKTKK